jgi:hypothetical protein
MILRLLIVWFLGMTAAPVAQDNPLHLSAQAGYDSLYEDTAAVPVFVSAANSGPPVEGELQVVVDSGGQALVYSAPISLPTGADKRVPLVVYVPPFTGDLAVSLVADGETVAQTSSNRLRSVGSDTLFYGVITPDVGGLAFLETIPGDRTDAAVAFLQPDDLPEVASAWDALDVLVLDDSDTGRLTAGQQSALRAWVESGGQLVVTGGPGGPRTAAGVADLLPVTVEGVTSVPDLPALSDYAGAPLESAGPYVITTGRAVAGSEVVIAQDGTPILARRALGRGQVIFLALDPKLAPLAGWVGGAALWGEIAAGAPSRPPWGEGIQDGYAAMQSVAAIPSLSLPSTLQLLLFLFVYTLIIGPVNYLILRRLKRRELAWITTPALILLFSAATFLTGFRTRGNAVTVNEMTVAFGSAEAERLRAQTVLGLYSPRRDRHDVGLPYDSSAFPFQESFGALLGTSNLNSIARAADVTLRGVRTDTGQIAAFIVESHPERPAVQATAALVDEGRAVEVTVRNDTAETLEDAVLIYGSAQTALGDLAPGAATTKRLTLRATTAQPTPEPLFPAAVIIPNPLFNDPSLILGTSTFYDDRQAYPRWQLLQSHYNSDPSNVGFLPDPAELVTLGGWLPGGLPPATVAGAPAEQSGATLLFLEIPVRERP